MKSNFGNTFLSFIGLSIGVPDFHVSLLSVEHCDEIQCMRIRSYSCYASLCHNAFLQVKELKMSKAELERKYEEAQLRIEEQAEVISDLEQASIGNRVAWAN